MTTVDQPRPIAEDLDPAVRPQDDLFGYVNGRWIAAAAIPEDKATYGSFEILRDKSEEDVRAIIAEAAASDAPEGSDAASAAQKIGDLYTSFMDEAAVEAAGVAPLAPVLARIDAVADVEGLMRLQGELAREGIGGVLGAGVWIDKTDPNRYLIHIAQSGLGLPDESYYRADEHAAIREAYVPHVARMLELAEAVPTTAHADAVAQRIMAFETRLAAAHWDRTATRDAVATYNLTTAAQLRAALPTATTWLEGMGADPHHWDEVVVGQPDVVEAVAGLLVDEPLEVWKEWLTWRVIRSMAGYLSSDLVDASFDFYGRTLTGAPQLRPRWKRGVALVEGLLGELVGQLYVERHYPPRAQEQMAVLIDHLVEAYRQRITDLDWMAADTRSRALEKLAAFTPKIGKPVRWKDYSALEIRPDDLLGNIRRAHAVESDRELAKLAGPVDRDEWFMTPQTVNAYYNPAMNEIVFPAALLQPPFFDPDRDPAYNYGAIGAVIGHEIGHGFDDQGSRYDGTGALVNWWTDVDRQAFDAKVQALTEQYDVFSPRDLDDAHTVDGGLTVGENIGDLGGVAVAFHAWQLYVADELGGSSPQVDGLTGDQRFFVGWAQVWRVLARTEEAIRRLTIDPHSPPEFRANVVRNVDGFHEAFGTGPGDGLWLDPDERVRIW
ncbi:M13 family metallopeptidase [Euzebya sp.]|uniref:M13 family metallopeptidase n=1 Tax=Euzebya sp. TaxID=1971409 RepID=UPI003516BE7A